MSNLKAPAALIKKFEARQATIAVVGLGYVGLPLAICFAEAGYRVYGIDLDTRKIDALQRGESYIDDVPSAAIQAQSSRFTATSSYNVLKECDAVSICVPTPLDKYGAPDISYVISASESVAENLHPQMVVVLESTTYPGTTTEVLLPRLSARNPEMEPGRDFYLAFSGERIDPGRLDWKVKNTPKIIGGVTPTCLQVATAYYEQAIDTMVPISSTTAAEMTKLFENTFRLVNIGLVNELLVMCDALKLNAWEIVNAAATKPFGFMKFTPGPGVGGHCIPIDPLYLSWKLQTLGYMPRFIQLASAINTETPRYWVHRTQDALNTIGKPVRGSRILVLGVAYKKDVSDVRESPALEIIHELEKRGAIVVYHDPHVPILRHSGREMKSVADLTTALHLADCTLIIADHSVYDWAMIQEQGRLIVDTRNVLA